MRLPSAATGTLPEVTTGAPVQLTPVQFWAWAEVTGPTSDQSSSPGEPSVPVTETESETEPCGFWLELEERVTIVGGSSTRTVSELVPAWLLAAVSSEEASSSSVKV